MLLYANDFGNDILSFIVINSLDMAIVTKQRDSLTCRVLHVQALELDLNSFTRLLFSRKICS